ncbi:hypothetical protein PR048_033493 [Dryococelus australis]|uniref:Uncharacterized protein n=1 Tax=Dryococelus australis TaxID=614101 RepID=A0ABQ9G0F6_9NEOP|nr:hypothetical protein PR048_033493 [Dryococelus australis]
MIDPRRAGSARRTLSGVVRVFVGLRDEQSDVGHLWSIGSGNYRKSARQMCTKTRAARRCGPGLNRPAGQLKLVCTEVESGRKRSATPHPKNSQESNFCIPANSVALVRKNRERRYAECNGRGKREYLEKTHTSVEASDTFSKCEISGEWNGLNLCTITLSFDIKTEKIYLLETQRRNQKVHYTVEVNMHEPAINSERYLRERERTRASFQDRARVTAPQEKSKYLSSEGEERRSLGVYYFGDPELATRREIRHFIKRQGRGACGRETEGSVNVLRGTNNPLYFRHMLPSSRVRACILRWDQKGFRTARMKIRLLNFPTCELQLLSTVTHKEDAIGVVVRLLASHICEPGSITSGVAPGIFTCGNRSGRCHWSAGFPGVLPYAWHHLLDSNVLWHTQESPVKISVLIARAKSTQIYRREAAACTANTSSTSLQKNNSPVNNVTEQRLPISTVLYCGDAGREPSMPTPPGRRPNTCSSSTRWFTGRPAGWTLLAPGAHVAVRNICQDFWQLAPTHFLPPQSSSLLTPSVFLTRGVWQHFGSKVSSGISRFLSPFHPGAAPYSPQSPSSALKTSMLRAVQISSLTLSLHCAHVDYKNSHFIADSLYEYVKQPLIMRVSAAHSSKMASPASDMLECRSPISDWLIIRHPEAQSIGSFSQHAVANQSQGLFPEPRAANQIMVSRTSKEPPLYLILRGEHRFTVTEDKVEARLHSAVYTRASDVCSLAAAPESSQCYSTPGSMALAASSLASLLLAQSSPDPGGNAGPDIRRAISARGRLLAANLGEFRFYVRLRCSGPQRTSSQRTSRRCGVRGWFHVIPVNNVKRARSRWRGAAAHRGPSRGSYDNRSDNKCTASTFQERRAAGSRSYVTTPSTRKMDQLQGFEPPLTQSLQPTASLHGKAVPAGCDIRTLSYIPAAVGIIANYTFPTRLFKPLRASKPKIFEILRLRGLGDNEERRVAGRGISESANLRTASFGILTSATNGLDYWTGCPPSASSGPISARHRPSTTWSASGKYTLPCVSCRALPQQNPRPFGDNVPIAADLPSERPEVLVTFWVGPTDLYKSQRASESGVWSLVRRYALPKKDEETENTHRPPASSAMFSAFEFSSPETRLRQPQRKTATVTDTNEHPEKTHRPTASSGTIPTCENPVARPWIEPGSPWWEASVQTAQPPWPPLVGWKLPEYCKH